MNVTCTGCPAKYAVPDEKVRGKKVRITCKHCGTNIVVDGTAVDTAADALPKPAAPVASQPAAAAVTSAPDVAPAQARVEVKVKEPVQAKPAAAPAEVMFIVGFADDRQHPHTISQIVELYSAGKIDDEALVWKDGMPDWLSPFDVPELAAAFRAKNVAPRAAAPVPAAAPAAAPAPAFAAVAEDEATLVVRSPLDDPEVAAAIAAAGVSVKPAAAAAPTPAASAAKPAEESMFGKAAAARRVEKRPGAVDLFGGVADAGSEGDVSLDLGSIDERAQKMTGARNESSVLFSLDALTKPDPKAKKATEKDREREASAALFGESPPDSLMNLGGGGLSALAAPDFTKPVSAAAIAQAVRPSDPVEVPNSPANKGRGGVVLLVGFLGIAAAAAVAFVMMKKQPAADTVSVTPSAATQLSASAEPSSPEAPAASNAPAASAPAASAAASASAAPAASGAPVASASASVAAKPTSSSGAPATPAAPAAAAATPVAASKPAEPAAGAKPAEAPAAPATPATPDGAAFDKNAAVAALGAAAANAASCKTADGPTGSGKVSVTFAPSGRATATSVAGELAGTEVGGCVARLFRAAKVPPFAGDPVTVSKSFSIQ